MEKIILAIDIGGTKIAVGIVTTSGQILSSLTASTLQKGPEAGIEQVISLGDDLLQRNGLTKEQVLGIGVGIPAVLERETDYIIWGPNLSGWKNVDLRGALEKHFLTSVCIEYDGHTAVLGEWWKGAAQGFQSVVCIIIGTGVGGGMVLDGTLIRGVSRLAGAVGWFSLGRTGDIDDVKARMLGSWESQIAGPGIARRAQELLTQADQPSCLRSLKNAPTAKDVFAAAKTHDLLAKQITDETAELIGIGAANIVSLVNPEIVVLGGSIGSNADFLLPQITAVIERFAQPVSAKAFKLVTSRLGANAGLLGAAYSVLLRMKY